ncbi:MAG: DUF4347 domain-containing protein, partial [Planctomycetaceae bacterium]|nr:DUF4347 domain-containing protein [Planctomycetaceae bacterium]
MSLWRLYLKTRLLIAQALHELHEPVRAVEGARTVQARQLEERILLSASPALPPDVMLLEAAESDASPQTEAADTDHGTTSLTEETELTTSAEQDATGWNDSVATSGVPFAAGTDETAPGGALTRSVLVIIDSAVSGSEALAKLIPAINEAQTGTPNIAILDAAQDGFEQVAEILARSPEIHELHLVLTDSRESVSLGRTRITGQTIDTVAPALRSWQHFLAVDGEIIIHGTQLSSTIEGLQLLDQIAALTATTMIDGEASVVVPAVNPAHSDFFSDLMSTDLAEVEADVLTEDSLWPSSLSSTTIVFLDAGIEGLDSVLSTLNAEAAADAALQIEVLSRDADGITRVTEVLQSLDNTVSAVHFLTHGTSSGIRLGNRWLNQYELLARGSEIALWGNALTSEADLLFYGCDVAGSSSGRLLLDSLALLTGADVTASEDPTGAAALGGNWDLEFQTGTVEAAVIIDQQLQGSWQGLLSTFTVTNVNDSGAGSFRQAIIDANATPGTDTITFNIAGSGPHTINVLSQLPFFNDTVIIDGWSEPDYAGTPVIVLNGASAGAGVWGLDFNPGSDGSLIRGLVVQNFSTAGIDLSGTGGHTIVGTYVGTNAAGTSAAGNTIGLNLWNSSNNTIGGTSAAERNLISGNTNIGLNITGTSTGNVIQGNYIGTDAAGTASVGNTWYGILLNGDDNIVGGTATGTGNLISGNLYIGLTLWNGATGNVVQGNLIGTDVTGAASLGNGSDGLVIEDSAGNTIGGTTAAARNIISGNADNGIFVTGAGSTGNSILGNYIGTNQSGTAALANSSAGIEISASASATIVGGAAAGAANVISGNT